MYSLGRFKCIVVDRSNDTTEGYFRGEGVAMIDDWFFVWAIPTVH